MTETSVKFEQWAILEIMGHDRYAGLVTEQAIGGCNFVRVDVPEIDGRPAFTKLFGQGSIFSITPVTENVAREAAHRFQSRPITIVGGDYQRRLPYAGDDGYGDFEDED